MIFLPVLDAQVVHRRGPSDAGAADEHVQATESVDGCGDERLEVIAAPHVGLLADGCPAGLFDPAGDVGEPVAPARPERDPGAALRQQQGGRLADAAAHPGDRHHPVLQCHHVDRRFLTCCGHPAAVRQS